MTDNEARARELAYKLIDGNRWLLSEFAMTRLRAEPDALRPIAKAIFDAIQSAESRGRAAGLRRAREALSPFGKSRKIFSGHQPYDNQNFSDSFGLEIIMATTEDGRCDFTLGQFRRAQRALASIDAEIAALQTDTPA